ncbi:hypothetical protein MRX96_037694 [Rhipicephalus microplus]
MMRKLVIYDGESVAKTGTASHYRGTSAGPSELSGLGRSALSRRRQLQRPSLLLALPSKSKGAGGLTDTGES